ncbi:BPTI/Kunitz domain-containing protein 4-like [Gordionus sp. m RMFG-2023]|uniref:BPTI/Kunitz domain-containing protein 4-like n=1 Tax=Gordionus sp. m RMFG-2023 TaxID=3053472 RepID=UPI0031FCFDED
MIKSLKFTLIILLVILSLCYSSVAVDNIIRTRFRLKRSKSEDCPITCFRYCPNGYVLDKFGCPTYCPIICFRPCPKGYVLDWSGCPTYCPIICFWHCPKGYVLDWFGSPTCKCED